MKFVKLAAAAVSAGLLIGAASSAQAVTYTLSLAQISSFADITSTDAGVSTTVDPPIGGSVGLNTHFTTNGAQTADVGVGGLGILFADGDSLALSLANVNENTWSFKLFVDTTVGLFSTATVAVAADSVLPFSYTLFSALLSGAGAGSITDVYVRVSGVLPVAGSDYQAEYRIAPIPIPPAIALFGGALAGLGFLSRRRRNKSSLPA